MTEAKIITAPFSKEVQAVLDPELVKIRTIKEKHVNEIHESKYPPESGKVLGRYSIWVIFQITRYHHDGPISHLVKVKDIDLIDYTLRVRQSEQKEQLTPEQVESIRNEVFDFLDATHQLFSA